MKLWQKKENNLNEKVDSFTVGKDRVYDMVLAEFDCEASIAHVKILGRVGLINNGEVKKLCLVLNEIKKEILVAMSGIQTGNTPIYDGNPFA